MSTSDESDDFLQDIRRAKLKRRDALRLKQAQFGKNLPAEDLVELAELDKELGLTDLAISAPTSTKFAEQLGPTGQFQVLTQMIDNLADHLGERIDDRTENLGKRIEGSTTNLSERITTGETTSREWRVAERMANIMRDARVRAAFRWVGVFLLLIILALIVLAIVVAINATK